MRLRAACFSSCSCIPPHRLCCPVLLMRPAPSLLPRPAYVSPRRLYCPAPTVVPVLLLRLILLPRRYWVTAGCRTYSDDRARTSQSVMPMGATAGAPRKPACSGRPCAKTVAAMRLGANRKFTGPETLHRQVLSGPFFCCRTRLARTARGDTYGRNPETEKHRWVTMWVLEASPKCLNCETPPGCARLSNEGSVM